MIPFQSGNTEAFGSQVPQGYTVKEVEDWGFEPTLSKRVFQPENLQGMNSTI